MSAKMGRPVIGEKKSVDVKVRISENENQRLLAYCEKTNATRAEVIRNAIKRLLDKKE